MVFVEGKFTVAIGQWSRCAAMSFKGQFTAAIGRGGEISKMYTCPRTTGCKKALVRTKALLANEKARFVNIMI